MEVIMTNIREFLNYAIGFDDIFNSIENLKYNERPYPHFDVVKVDDKNYSLEVALAGYKKENIDLQIEDNILTIKGSSGSEEKNIVYSRKGISSKSFTKRLQIADHLECKKATFEDGMLKIFLVDNKKKNLKQIKID